MNVVIVGGGSAGWITALMVKRFIGWASITVIESSEIGIIGAGEGTTPQFVSYFLDRVGISVADLIRNTGATIKMGVKFVDWNGDGDQYFHPFDDPISGSLELGLADPRGPHLDLDRISYGARLAYANRVPMALRPPPERDIMAAPERHIMPKALFAVHFDASRLADYLRVVAIGRGVRRIDAKVTGFDQAPSGAIEHIRLGERPPVPADLVFDCTGFHRLILGKLYNIPWVDLSEELPVDRAIPFFLPSTTPRPPYTTATALKNGWMWSIPLQDRVGCGYVYDSSFATDDAARAELRSMFGPELDLARTLSFKAGYFERSWEHNCVGVGLSTGFLEPLEATAIWALLLSVNEFLKVHFAVDDPRSRATFNEYHRAVNERMANFLYLHYLGQRRDTPFWQTFEQRTRMPPRIGELLGEGGARWMFNSPDALLGHPAPFINTSYTQICAGIRRIDMDVMRRYWEYFNLAAGAEAAYGALDQRLRQETAACMDHDAFLAYLFRGAGEGSKRSMGGPP